VYFFLRDTRAHESSLS